jgi:hypothetical protein
MVEREERLRAEVQERIAGARIRNCPGASPGLVVALGGTVVLATANLV